MQFRKVFGKHDFGMFFLMLRWDALRSNKKVFRSIRVSVFREKASKMKCEKGSSMSHNSSFGRAGVRIVSFNWEVFLRALIFDEF